jgi:hypothetical protein
MLSFPFEITKAGSDALQMGAVAGNNIRLTHVQIGSGNKVIDRDEEALVVPEATAPISFASKINADVTRLVTSFTIEHDFEASEVGVWIGDPAVEDSILLAYYALEEGSFSTQRQGIDFIFEFDLSIPSASVEIETDESGTLAAVLIHNHETDPHAHDAKFAAAVALAGEAISAALDMETVSGMSFEVVDEKLTLKCTFKNLSSGETREAIIGMQSASTDNSGLMSAAQAGLLQNLASKTTAYVTVSDPMDVDQYHWGSGKIYLTNDDPEAPNLGLPPELSAPVWLQADINDAKNEVTQTAWDNTAQHIFTRCGSINRSDPESVVATWTPWNSVAVPQTVKHIEVEADPDGQPEGTYLVITFDTEEGDQFAYINLSQIIGGGYEAGNSAITVSTDNKIALKLDEDSGLEIGEGGLKLSEDIAGAAAVAQQSAEAAASSAGDAAAHSSSAAGSASAAQSSKDLAEDAKAAAAGSATAASGSASGAAESATAASTSATNAANSASSAADSASSVGSALEGIAYIDAAQEWTKGQRGAVVALTSGATVAIDMSAANNFSLTLAVNATLGNPSNLSPGQSGILAVKQDATGSRTLAFASQYVFTGGEAPALSTAAGAVDYLAYYVEAAGRVFISLAGDVK